MLSVGLLPMTAQASQGGKLAAITFDDGPSASQTPRLLDGLKERGAKATFFVLGQNAQDNLDIIQRAYREGHEIASHTWSHQDLTGLSNAGVQEEIQSTARLLDKVCGGSGAYLVRPPYGSTSSRIESVAGVPLVHWSVDPEDWRYRDADTVCENIVDNAHDGAIILVHDIYRSSVDGALRAIDELQSEGYEFVTVTELHRRRGVALNAGESYYSCRPNGTDLGALSVPKISYVKSGDQMTVTLSADKGMSIYYTTDGSEPDSGSKKYSGPFTLAYGSSIKAFAAYDLNGGRSGVASLVKGQSGAAPAPQILLNNGKIELQSATKDGTIYYTTDGSAATEKSQVYSGAFSLERGRYIHAMTAGGYYSSSPETVVYYTDRGNLFADVDPDSWYYEPMDRLAEAGLMSGMGDHIYEPHTKLTRGMLVTILYAYEGKTFGGQWDKTNPFTDVNSDAWYAEAVEWAYRSGVTAGYTETTFAPNLDLTRQELSVMIDGFLKYRGAPLSRGNSCAGIFADYDKISDWARSSIEAMVQAGMLAGDGKNVNPQDTATRAEVAAIVRRVMDYEASGAGEVIQPEQEATEPTETVPATQPVETAPAETVPVTEPAETAPTTEPAETEPATELETVPETTQAATEQAEMA